MFFKILVLIKCIRRFYQQLKIIFVNKISLDRILPMAKALEVNNGSFVLHFVAFIVLFIVLVICVAFAFDFSDTENMAGGIVFGSVVIIVMFFWPIAFVSDDVFTSNCKILKDYNELAEKNKKFKISISHPRKYLVIFLTIVSPLSMGLLWFVALFLAIGKFTIILPDEKTVLLKNFPEIWNRINVS